MKLSYLEEYAISRQQLDILYAILMKHSPTLFRNLSNDTDPNIITGQCDAYGIKDLDITLTINSISGDIEVRLEKVSSVFAIKGLDWLLLDHIDFTFTIYADETVQPNGSVNATSGLVGVPFQGELYIQDTLGQSYYYWQLSTPSISNLDFTKIIPVDDSYLHNLIKEVKDLTATIIEEIGLLIAPGKNTLTLKTPLSWNVFNDILVDQLAVSISSGYDDLTSEQKDFMVNGTLSKGGQAEFFTRVILHQVAQGIEYELSIHAFDTESLPMESMIQSTDLDTHTNWLPAQWNTKLKNSSLKRMDISFISGENTLNVSGAGILDGENTTIQFSTFKFFANRFFSFSAGFDGTPTSIENITSNILGIQLSEETKSWIPPIKLGLQKIGFNQLEKTFDLAGAIELGAINPIGLYGDFAIQWLHGFRFRAALYSYASPLTLESIASALTINFDSLKLVTPTTIVNNILATSFESLSIDLDYTIDSYSFSGQAKMFGLWEINLSYRYFALEGIKYSELEGTISNLDIDIKEIPQTLGFSAPEENWGAWLPDIGISPKYLRFSQKEQLFDISSDFRFVNTTVSTRMISYYGVEKKMFLRFNTQEHFPLSFLTFFKAVVPNFTTIDSFPIDVLVYQVHLTIESKKNKKRITGYAEAAIKILDIEISLTANSLEGESNSWNFTGKTGEGQNIPIGNLITDIAAKFGLADQDIPEPIQSLIIKDLSVSFNTQSKDFTFAGTGELQINGVTTIIHLDINIVHRQDGTFTKHYAGQLVLNDKVFDLIFDQTENSQMLIAGYHNTGDNNTELKTLLQGIVDEVPEGITISLNDALLVNDRSIDPHKNLFVAHLGNGINLSRLPLVGELAPENQTLQLVYQLLFASQDFLASEITSINQHLPEGFHALEDKDVTKGFDVDVSLQLGDEFVQLTLPIKANNGSSRMETATDPIVADPEKSDGIKWYSLQKSFGPLYFNRLGAEFQSGKLSFFLDASLSLSGLTITLDGLSVTSPITKLNPEFNLKGLGIDFKNDVLEIGGAFLREHIGDPAPGGYDEYDGLAIFKTKTMAINAIGSYANLNGHPSLFIYTALNSPIGGPPFFFITGLSAGFGYNRKLIIPTIDHVLDFPLVSTAIQGGSLPVSAGKQELTKALQAIHKYIPPATGQLFFAVGVRFTTFKLIDSTLLLAASFGNRFELDLLGISTLVVPPKVGKTPLAVIEMALKGAYVPEEGFVGLRGQLTDQSYILSKDCHLTGGFAFYSWFSGEHEGDFVTTIGGYHPKFTKPAHYPDVPRIAINWKIDSHTSISGDAYFALCSHALMAGGHLSANYHNGSLKAWFNIGADFLVSWKPYHYEASAYANIGASYTYHFFGTHHISIDVSAKVHLWGPEFGGKATIDLGITSKDIHFGKSSSQIPDALDWNEFDTSFLPDKNLCSLSLTDGMVTKGETEDHLGVLNPKYFKIQGQTFIPSKTLVTSMIGNPGTTTGFGVAPMDISTIDKSTLTVTVLRKEGTWEDCSSEFGYTTITKNAPTALWGKDFKPKVNGNQFVENTLAGVEITPEGNPSSGTEVVIDASFIKYHINPMDRAIQWEPDINFESQNLSETQVQEKINTTITSDTVVGVRQSIMDVLNIQMSVDLSNQVANSYITQPKVAVAA